METQISYCISYTNSPHSSQFQVLFHDMPNYYVSLLLPLTQISYCISYIQFPLPEFPFLLHNIDEHVHTHLSLCSFFFCCLLSFLHTNFSSHSFVCLLFLWSSKCSFLSYHLSHWSQLYFVCFLLL